MAGLVCAARARELGMRPSLLEKGTRPGGSMLLSSCVVWRHLDFADFRAECPGGDEPLQRLIWERLDDALAWLVSLGGQPVWDDTENPRTTGKRFDPCALTRLLARDVELETPLPEAAASPLVLATGGFAKRLASERGLLLRANPWSDGDGLDWATARGGAVTGGLDEFYGRALPAPPARIREEDFVPLSQLYGRWARVFRTSSCKVRHTVSMPSNTCVKRPKGVRPSFLWTCTRLVLRPPRYRRRRVAAWLLW